MPAGRGKLPKPLRAPCGMGASHQASASSRLTSAINISHSRSLLGATTSLKWRVLKLRRELVKGARSMAPIKYEIGPATEKFGTRLIIDVHGDVIAEVPMLLNSKMSLDERCAERDRRAHMIVNALNNQESGKSPM
jgi:hypothetical protein